MVKDYACQIYLKAHEQYRALETDGASRAKALAAWIARPQQEWQNIRIEAVEQAPDATLAVGTEVGVRTRVQLGLISPEDVAVEFYLGRLNPAGGFIDAISAPMSPVGKDSRGNYLFEADTSCARSGLHGFTFRVRPQHPDLSVPFITGLICGPTAPYPTDQWKVRWPGATRHRPRVRHSRQRS